ncbi:MAG: hypothetical protein WCJ66_06215 [Verrucomicrobiota bacterium]
MKATSTYPCFAVAGLLACVFQPANADDNAIPVPRFGDSSVPQSPSTRTHSWELPPLTVVGQRESSTADDDLVGNYAQPRWTTVRRFSEVRTYVIPQGQVEFEYWFFDTLPSSNQLDTAKSLGQSRPQPEIKQQYEIEMGLGHRLQLDLYLVYLKDGTSGTNQLDSTKFELRYALADWGKLWGNPTLYGEWTQAARGADSVEAKLLLCDDINQRWAWASNLVAEQKTGDARDLGLEWNSALACSAVDRVLSVGVETNIANISSRTDPSTSHRDNHWEISAGPSIRYNPIPQAHAILSEFIGLNRDTPQAKTALVIGWEF